MLRPLLAFGCLALTAFLLAPTVQSVHEQVEALDIKRDLPRLWKWDQPEPPLLLPPLCDDSRRSLYSEVDRWPPRIRKNETFSLGGFVRQGDANGPGVAGVTVELFLNETKSLPGEPLGVAVTGGDGRFILTASIPFDLQATRYHLVAHALEKRDGCVVYKEHWSDPEMDVTSPTRLVLHPVDSAVAGHPFHLRGTLLDSVGAPVRNANVTLTVDGGEHRVVTDGDGGFRWEMNVSAPRTVKWSASYAGTKYYGGSKASSEVEVVRDDLRLDVSGLELLRGSPTSFSGRVVLSPGAKPAPLRFSFEGVKLAPCVGCPAASNLTVTPDAEGAFQVTLVAGSDQPAGPFTARAEGGGLTEKRTLQGRVVVPVTLTLSAANDGWFARSLTGAVGLEDEAGRPFPGVVAVETPEGWRTGSVDAAGNFTFAAASACGDRLVRAHYNGTDDARPALQQKEVAVCPLIAALPPWLVATPWWVWPLLALALAGAWYAFRSWRAATATTITGGPPLTLAHTLPNDAAAGVVGVGERAVVTAYLEQPLPDGHTLRMGLARKTAPADLSPDLSAEHHVVPDELGETPVRAEILDPRGRVVTRRTVVLHVVRYAEEIESRYRRLRRASGVGEAVTPREFEAWLRERAPDLDPAVAARLVGVFEEADYGPRDAGRAELVAYLEAEAALPEVRSPAVA